MRDDLIPEPNHQIAFRDGRWEKLRPVGPVGDAEAWLAMPLTPQEARETLERARTEYRARLYALPPGALGAQCALHDTLAQIDRLLGVVAEQLGEGASEEAREAP